MLRSAVLTFLVLAACSSSEATRSAGPPLALPPMKVFATPTPTTPRLSNTEIARDFIDLTMTLERGAPMPAFSRFEGPVTVRVIGTPPPTLTPDLDRLLARLRSEAQIDISRVPATQTASITIHPVTRAQIRRAEPSAACFARPNVRDWADYRARRRAQETDWARLAERRQITIFLPRDVAPQEIRACLHEEIGLALGPVNDLYRLTQSVFNDDNYHSVLTGYDMLILRTAYDPALKTGMSKRQLATVLPRVLNRLNPKGRVSGAATMPDSPAWLSAIRTATNAGLPLAQQRRAAERANLLAGIYPANDPRRAFTAFVLGQLLFETDPSRALGLLIEARNIYAMRPDASLQEARVLLPIAGYHLSGDRAETARRLADTAARRAMRAERADLLALTLLIRAEAEERLGRIEAATQTRQDALAWARYGFGAEPEIRARVEEIHMLNPENRKQTVP